MVQYSISLLSHSLEIENKSFSVTLCCQRSQPCLWKQILQLKSVKQIRIFLLKIVLMGNVLYAALNGKNGKNRKRLVAASEPSPLFCVPPWAMSSLDSALSSPSAVCLLPLEPILHKTTIMRFSESKTSAVRGLLL